MNVKELRIGSFIYDDEKIISQVNGFAPFDHSTRCDESEGCYILLDLHRNDGSIDKGFECDSNLTTPIVITEEWLLKLGFEEYDHILKIHLDYGLGLNYNKDSKQWYLDINFINTSKIELNYIHQLQNLYFELTNKELKYEF